jgi:hypothetical protein
MTVMVPTQACAVISARFRFVSLFFSTGRTWRVCGV